MITLQGTIQIGREMEYRYFWNYDTKEIIEDSPAGTICIGYANTITDAIKQITK